jgi:hypothetical protein
VCVCVYVCVCVCVCITCIGEVISVDELIGCASVALAVRQVGHRGHSPATHHMHILLCTKEKKDIGVNVAGVKKKA